MKVRYANHQDIPQLKNIWKICFGDSDLYIDNFLKQIFMPENTVVVEMNHHVVGVVYLLPAKLGSTPFMYGYAIGVLPEHRGKGYTQKMLLFIKNESQKKGFVFGLHPANDKLFSFYKQIGLKEMYGLKLVNASDFAYDSVCELIDITPEEFFRLRDAAFPNLVLWDLKMISYILHETCSFGGFAKKIIINQNVRVLLGICKDNAVLIKETTMTDEEIKAFSASIKSYFHADQIFFLLPTSSTLQGEIRTMILGFDDSDRETYMNLFLD